MLYDVALFLVLVGAINWGTIGLYNFNIVSYINTNIQSDILPKIIYTVIGLAGLIIIVMKLYKTFYSNTLYYKNYEFHWCNDGPEGDAHCRRAGYGNKCLKNTCIVDTKI